MMKRECSNHPTFAFACTHLAEQSVVLGKQVYQHHGGGLLVVIDWEVDIPESPLDNLTVQNDAVFMK